MKAPPVRVAAYPAVLRMIRLRTAGLVCAKGDKLVSLRDSLWRSLSTGRQKPTRHACQIGRFRQIEMAGAYFRL